MADTDDNFNTLKVDEILDLDEEEEEEREES